MPIGSIIAGTSAVDALELGEAGNLVGRGYKLYVFDDSSCDGGRDELDLAGAADTCLATGAGVGSFYIATGDYNPEAGGGGSSNLCPNGPTGNGGSGYMSFGVMYTGYISRQPHRYSP